jgi:UDP-N-acetyl-2-amino-2-deoxyglucuronate dehydrogenase
MRVGIIGTGAISHKHAQAYRNIGFELVACSGLDAARGRTFADQYGCEAIADWHDLVRDPRVDFVDVCTFPDFRLPIVEHCAAAHKPVQLQKPIAADLATAGKIVEIARAAGITLNVVSQHRFDDSSQFLKRALAAGRLGEILQADAYVKWWRPPTYYSRPVKGSWSTEGGGALINQGIHSVDLLLWFAGSVQHVFAEWKTGAVHKIESEDMVSAVLRYQSGAIGVIQAATAFQPGYPERIEISGTHGTAIITGDRLTTWDVENDSGEKPPLAGASASGASDPMAISLAPFERQFVDFAEAIRTRRDPLVSGAEGHRALALVDAIYRSCRSESRVTINSFDPGTI